MKAHNKTSDVSGQTELFCYSTLQLAALYGIHVKTMRLWLKPFATAIGPRIGRLYNIRQVGVIFEKLGVPGIKADG